MNTNHPNRDSANPEPVGNALPASTGEECSKQLERETERSLLLKEYSRLTTAELWKKVRYYADQLHSNEALLTHFDRSGREWVHEAQEHLGILEEIVDEHGFSLIEKWYAIADLRDVLGPSGYYANYFGVTHAPQLQDDAVAFKVADVIELQVRQSVAEAWAETFKSDQAAELVIWCEDRDAFIALGDFGFSAKTWEDTGFLQCEWNNPKFFQRLESLISKVCNLPFRISVDE